jgi:hypothetical protein
MACGFTAPGPVMPAPSGRRRARHRQRRPRPPSTTPPAEPSTDSVTWSPPSAPREPGSEPTTPSPRPSRTRPCSPCSVPGPHRRGSHVSLMQGEDTVNAAPRAMPPSTGDRRHRRRQDAGRHERALRAERRLADRQRSRGSVQPGLRHRSISNTLPVRGARHRAGPSRIDSATVPLSSGGGLKGISAFRRARPVLPGRQSPARSRGRRTLPRARSRAARARRAVRIS